MRGSIARELRGLAAKHPEPTAYKQLKKRLKRLPSHQRRWALERFERDLKAKKNGPSSNPA